MIRFLLENYKLIFLGLLILVTILSIHPNFIREGAMVLVPRDRGLQVGDIVVEVNGVKIKNARDIEEIPKNLSYYRVKILREVFPYIYLKKDLILTSLNSTFQDIPPLNLKFGIDLAGGTRIIMKPVGNYTDKDIEAAKDIIEKRLDFYGLKGADVRIIYGLGEKYIQIEMAGSPEEIYDILKKQGKLEAKIGNKTVFTGQDIVQVCTVTSQYCVSEVINRGEYWEGVFSIVISKEAAKRFAEMTKNLSEVCNEYECYLNETLDIYLDNKLITSLNIVSDLKGKEVTNPAITMRGPTKEDVKDRMKTLQTILMTGKLPITLEISRIDEISPVYGKEVFRNIMIVWVAAIFVVGLVIFLRYRNPKISGLMFFIMLVETFSTLGVAGLIGWTLDIASLAGIIAAVGTGLDDQIILTEEVLSGRKKKERVEKSIAKAFFVIIAAFSVAFASMLPLLFAGAGILKGFAITNIIGIAIGVFITRPAYAELLRRVVK